MAPIHACAEMGNLSEVMRLVDRGVDSVHAKNSKGRTPLMVAALHGHSELVRFLLLCGSAVEARDEDSLTALMLASAHGRVCVVCDLLLEGATARVTDRWGRTPLTLAAEHGHIDVVHRLLQLGADACDVNARGFGDGTTCLWMAALSDYDEVVRALLEAGADPTVPDAEVTYMREDRTPLDIAIEEGCTNCASLLQEWQRVYVLTKACKLHDAYVSITTTTTTTTTATTTHTSDTHNMRFNSTSSSTTTTTANSKTNSSNSNRGNIHPPVPPWLRTRTHTHVHTSASSSPSVVASIDLPVVCAGDGVRRCRHQLHGAHQLHDIQQLSQVHHRGKQLPPPPPQQHHHHLENHDHPHGQPCQHHHLPDPQQHQHDHHHHVALHTHDKDDEVDTCHADDCSPDPLRGLGQEVDGALEADNTSSQADDGGDGGVVCGGIGQYYAHGCGREYERVEHGACACVGECAGGGAVGCRSGLESDCDAEGHRGRVGCVVAHVVREFNAELLLELLDMMRKAPGW